MTRAEEVYHSNLALSRTEYLQGQSFLWSHPTTLGLVLGDYCNLRCLHCYQRHEGGRLFPSKPLARELRREMAGLFPFLTTLRVLGGEVFAMRAFSDLVDDVASATERPILSVSSNGTLIDERWAEQLVRTPFATVTISIDAATPETYRRLRRGGELEVVLQNIDRINRWKQRLGRQLPTVDSLFVVMRSNYREIPAFLELMDARGVAGVLLQTATVNDENRARIAGEVMTDMADLLHLRGMLLEVTRRHRDRAGWVRFCGLKDLLERHGLEAGFLREEVDGPYLAGEGAEPAALCPNPWNVLFVTETGDVHLCFLGEPVGNLYTSPLSAIWNSPAAVARRSLMLQGCYGEARCSPSLCGWREGRRAPAAAQAPDFAAIATRAMEAPAAAQAGPHTELLRDLLRPREQRIAELEALLIAGQRHIDHLEAKAAKAVGDFRRLEEACTGSLAARLQRRFRHWAGAAGTESA